MKSSLQVVLCARASTAWLSFELNPTWVANETNQSEEHSLLSVAFWPHCSKDLSLYVCLPLEQIRNLHFPDQALSRHSANIGEMSTKMRRRLGKALLLLPKLLVDWFFLRFGPRHLGLWFRLNWRFKRPGLFPNLIRPRDLNDKIQWLKLFDQSELHVICADKLAVRDYVSSRSPSAQLTQLFWAGSRGEDIPWESLPRKCVIKTNHDSGSVWIWTPETPLTPARIVHEANTALGRKFGISSLEWPYVYIPPRLFVEEYLQSENGADLPNFRFHCSQGKVAFLQQTWGLLSGKPREVIFDSNGVVTGERLDPKYAPGEAELEPSAFSAMKAVAEQLAVGWQYVRVDLYWVRGKTYFGEMTFFPLAGWFHGDGQKRLGHLISLNLRSRTKPLSDGLDWISR